MGDEPRPWTVERVMAAAPDSASAVAGRKLATPGPWSGVGRDGPVLWGQCRGSARAVYSVLVDTAAPRYQCSCPSRKFPCKHVLGLLFRWAEGRLAEGELPGLAGGTPQFTVDPVPPPSGPAAAAPAKDRASVAAARARADEREARAAAGLTELQQWLADRVSDGLGRLAGRPEVWEEIAARMVDAQVPGVARALRRLATLPTGADTWAGDVLAQMALLDLLARAYARRDELPAELLATVRTHLGFTVPKAEVLRSPPVADRWAVFGLHDSADDERVATRRVWLRGRDTGRFAVVLLFSINGAPFETSVAPGMELDADVHFYPGRPPLRALIGNRRSEHERTRHLVVDAGEATVDRARDAWAAALAADPWLTVWPAVVRGRLTAGRADGITHFVLVGLDGRRLAVDGSDTLRWQALTAGGGDPVTWLGELRSTGFTPLALLDADLTGAELVVL